MRNEVAYQAYMGFLLKSLFWMSSVTLLIVFFLLLIDTLFLLFAPRQKAKIIRADIASIGEKTRFVDAHGIFISYTPLSTYFSKVLVYLVFNISVKTIKILNSIKIKSLR